MEDTQGDSSGKKRLFSGAFTSPITISTGGTFAIWFLDIGQGNGTFIECPGGETILVDLGSVSGNYKDLSGKEHKVLDTVKPLLQEFITKQLNGRSLTYLIISHADKDHVNLIPTLLSACTIDNVLVGGKATAYKNKLSKAPLVLKKLKEINGGSAFSESPTKPPSLIITKDPVEIRIVSVNAPIADVDLKAKLWGDKKLSEEEAAAVKEDETTKEEEDDDDDTIKEDVIVIDDSGEGSYKGTVKNTNSIVLSVRYTPLFGKTQQFLISADATFSTDLYILKNTSWTAEELASYALAGGHHGSRKSYSPLFLKAVNPCWIHFGAEFRDQFAHPEWPLVRRIFDHCPRIGKDYGPHGVVLGSRAAEDATMIRERMFDFLSKNTLRDIKRAALEKDDVPLVTTAKDWKPILAKFMGKVILKNVEPEEPWAQALFQECQLHVGKVTLLETRITEKPDPATVLEMAIMDWLTGDKSRRVQLEYWAARFAAMDDELTRVEALTFGQTKAYWEWVVTDLNIFTSMESGVMGVYWCLEVDYSGKVITSRR